MSDNISVNIKDKNSDDLDRKSSNNVNVNIKYKNPDVLDEKLISYLKEISIYKGIKSKIDLKNINYHLVENYMNSKVEITNADIESIINETEEYFKFNFPDYNNTQKYKALIKNETFNHDREFKMIDKVEVVFDERSGQYFASTLISGIDKIVIKEDLVFDNLNLLDDSLWCEINIDYKKIKNDNDMLMNKSVYYYEITEVKSLEIENYKEKKKKLKLNLKSRRDHFNYKDWMNILLRSIGIEPIETRMREETKIIILMRLLPLVEKNFNLIELGMPGTGKSYLHNDMSINSYLLSGAETTRAQLFYDKAKRKLGIVSNWDTIVFDEVTGVDFDKDLLQYMKTYMSSGRFNANENTLFADASFVFNGNTNRQIDYYLSSSHLLKPLPQEMQDTAFLDRINCYLPGWEVNFDRKNLFTNHIGLTRSFLFKLLGDLREKSNIDIFKKHDIELSETLSRRDRKAIKKNFSGLIKLLDPFDLDIITNEDIKKLLYYAIEMRQRVSEQQKRISLNNNFENKTFSFYFKGEEYKEKRLPEFNMYRNAMSIDELVNPAASLLDIDKDLLYINSKFKEKLMNSKEDELIINKPRMKFALQIRVNSLRTEFIDDNDEYYSRSVKSVINDLERDNLIKLENTNSKIDLLERYVGVYKTIEEDLSKMLTFFYDNAKSVEVYIRSKMNKDRKIQKDDLVNRDRKCNLNFIDVDKIDVFYRKNSGGYKSIRCEFGGLEIKIDIENNNIKNKKISYNYTRKLLRF